MPEKVKGASSRRPALRAFALCSGLTACAVDGSSAIDLELPTSPSPALEAQAGATGEEPIGNLKADIKLLRVSGTGCRPGSATSFYDPESKTVVVQFSEYAIDVTPQERTATVDCTVDLEVSHELGFAYAVAQVQYRGYAILPEGTSATLDTDYTFVGVAARAPAGRRHAIPNVIQQPWAIVDRVDPSALVFSDCSVKRTLSMRSSLTVTNATSGQNAHVDMESIESSLLPTEVTLARKPCVQ